MTISPSFPNLLQNGTPADATQVMADFFQLQNDVNANAAHNGANSDITSLTGLTTPLGIAYGGTGTTTGLSAVAAPLASPNFTGVPTAPTAAPGTNTTQLATTAFVSSAAFAPLASPALTGVPTAPTAAPGTNTTQLATTAFVEALLASPAFTGTPTAPTAAIHTNNTQLATTAYVDRVGAFAYVNFNGGSAAIRGSQGINSVVRNSLGNYTITANGITANSTVIPGTVNAGGGTIVNILSQAVNTVTIQTFQQSTGTSQDPSIVTCAIWL